MPVLVAVTSVTYDVSAIACLKEAGMIFAKWSQAEEASHETLAIHIVYLR